MFSTPGPADTSGHGRGRHPATGDASLQKRGRSRHVSAKASRNHHIPLEEAVVLIRRYRDRNPGEVRTAMFDRRILDQILAQPGAAGIRVSCAEHENGSPAQVLVGVDAEGNGLYEGDIGNLGHLCPINCSTEYSLLMR